MLSVLLLPVLSHMKESLSCLVMRRDHFYQIPKQLIWCYFVWREHCYALLSMRGGLIGVRGEKSILGEFWKRAARS